MTTITDLKEFKAMIPDQGFSFIDLYYNDKKVFSRNRTKPEFTSKLNDIVKKLNSPATKSGSYLIRCYTTPSGEIDEIYKYNKGGVDTLGNGEAPKNVVTIVEREKAPAQENVLTYAKALEYQNEIQRLTYENKRLEELNKSLQEQIDEYEEEEEEGEESPALAEPTGMQQVTSLIENILATAMPVLDRHFTIKEKSLELELIKAGRTPIQPQAPKVSQKDQEELTEKVNAWLDKIGEENEELYSQLEAMSQRVNSLEQFLVQIKSNLPEQFQDLESFIQQSQN